MIKIEFVKVLGVKCHSKIEMLLKMFIMKNKERHYGHINNI